MDDRRTGVLFALMATLLLAACEDIAVAPHEANEASITRGKAATQRLGCGACHAIPDIWPQGTTGPALTNFADRGLIAGKLPNRPGELAAYLLDPPATVPGTAMPKIPMTQQDAADIAAFLHHSDAR
ncbi:cytochrome c family protein [Novosphingobium sp. AP12]|uniref:c-type cytochrome n=1 Tax=Novosphingobium sp. AP12 TaxID=1144305 RepID=UPI0002721E6D|nr:c-type cytochrome [Novosphingobium sp. AP12]EJL35080.1 cytochrome c1 [Novosphingobium sp. AP12]